MVGHGGSCAGPYLADPTSSIPSHSAVIILFKTDSVIFGDCRVSIYKKKCAESVSNKS